MPLPLIIGGAAAIAGIAGIGSGIHGGVKMKEANDTMKEAKEKQEKAVASFEKKSAETTKIMDTVGKKELSILSSFKDFSDLIEKIQGRPEFKAYDISGVKIPDYKADELNKVSAGAGLLLGGVGGAAAGTAGGFAAAGATTSAVMALGTASTGTAISSLSGVAATNATLAALGGGSLAAGGGGMALGTAILGGATLGVGLLVGGIIFNVTGSKLSEKADEALAQAKRTEKEVNKIVAYLNDLKRTANAFYVSLDKVDTIYKNNLSTLDHVINFSEKVNWYDFTEKEKMVTQNTALLVGLLYRMCNTSLVLKDSDGDGVNNLNKKEIDSVLNDAEIILDNVRE